MSQGFNPDDAIASASGDESYQPYAPVTGEVSSDGITSPEYGLFPEFQSDTSGPPKSNAGDIVDDAISEDTDTKPLIPVDKPSRDKPKSGPPTGDEWLDFFSRVCLRFITEWYVEQVAFRGVDEDAVSDRDAAKLYLSKEERDTIAVPFAEYANKNPFMRKHGRQIVAFSGSFESLLILGTWFARVNRISRKYKPKHRRPVKAKVENLNGTNGQGASPEYGASGTLGGRIPEGPYGIFNPGGS